jgi:hypothetical protein
MTWAGTYTYAQILYRCMKASNQHLLDDNMAFGHILDRHGIDQGLLQVLWKLHQEIRRVEIAQKLLCQRLVALAMRQAQQLPARVYVRVCVCEYVCMSLYLCIHVCLYVYTYAYAYTHMYSHALYGVCRQ